MKRLALIGLVLFTPNITFAEIKLRQSTANQVIPLGVFLDNSDGFTPKTELTISNTDIKLWKAGATSLANKESGGATHMDGGVYRATLSANDTSDDGPLVMFVHVLDALPVRVECEVLPAALYDAWQAGTLPANVTQFGGSAGMFSGGRPEVNATHWGGTAVASANVRADMRQVDGIDLSMHSSGYLPADVRQFGGANGIFSSGRPEVTTSAAANKAIAARANPAIMLVGTVSGENMGQTTLSFNCDPVRSFDVPAGAMVIVLNSSGEIGAKRATSGEAEDNSGSVTVDAGFSLSQGTVGAEIWILATPPQLEN
jgi:hypothetical protein